MTFAQVVRVLILPPLSLFLLGLAALIVRIWWPRVGRWLLGTTVVASYLLCTGLGANVLVRSLEGRTQPLPKVSSGAAQAIVVLSAGRIEAAREYGGIDVPDYVGLGRLRYAARLQHETGLPVLVSGGFPSRRGQSYAESMATALRDDFRAPVRWIEDRSENTAENAKYSAAMLRKDGIGRILLVTDAMHMPRAERMFRMTGIEVVPAPTVFLGSSRVSPRDLLPTVEGLRRSNYALYEWAGLAWYAMRYGAPL
jgi:uncharacterized SAM-binding protein YcdF (DUF218 family)